MTTETQSPRWNYRRRALGVALCLAPVALLVASLIAGEITPWDRGLGLGLLACATIPTALNVYLSWVRPWRYRRRHGSLQGMRNVSGLPLVGTLLVVLGGIAGFGDWRVGVIGLVVLALDTGGSPWFLVATWRDSGLWDEPT